MCVYGGGLLVLPVARPLCTVTWSLSWPGADSLSQDPQRRASWGDPAALGQVAELLSGLLFFFFFLSNLCVFLTDAIETKQNKTKQKTP